MRKIILAMITIFFLSTPTRACEICGCGIGNYHIGLLPQFSHKFFGLRYQFSRYRTVMADDPSQFSKDYYKTVELWAGWNIGKRWQLIAILPFNYVRQVSDDGVSNKQGIGDIAAMVNYKIFDKAAAVCKDKLLTQQLWIGGGIKLPTGKFDVDATDPAVIALANTQTGSASTDFMLNAVYNVQLNKLGMNSSASYKINTANRDKYSFGNRFSASSFISYRINQAGFVILPNAGLLYENTSASKLQKLKLAQSGGSLLSAAAGLEIGVKKFIVGANVQVPLRQDFASGQTELKLKGMVHIGFAF